MVDQTKVNGADHPAETTTGAVARSAGELLHDLVTLSELQGRLLITDAREGVSHLLTPIAVIAAGILVLVGSIPIALVTLALLLIQTTTLTQVQAFGVSLLVGLVIGALLAGGGFWCLRHGNPMFHRTQTEWRQNVKWAKDALSRITNTRWRQQSSQY
jgi:hypothetical protein